MNIKPGLMLATILLCNAACTSQAMAAPTEAETQLLSDIAKDGMLEVDLGKIAAGHAKHSDVQAFAKHMVKDHSQANAKLKAAAKKDNIQLPGEISADQQKKKDELQALKGGEFDKAYMKEMVLGHEKAVAAVEKETKIGSGAPQGWAVDTLPVIKEHRKDAIRISSDLESSKTK